MDMDKDQYRRLCDRMKRLASRREYCSGDIRKKVLEASQGDEAMAEMARLKDITPEDEGIDIGLEEEK